MLATLLAAGLSASVAGPSAAQLGRKSWEFYPHVGVLLPGRPDFLTGVEEDPNPGTLWGIAATYHYTDYVGVELGFSKGTANGPEGDNSPEADVLQDVSFDFWELNGFVNSGALKPLQLFATAGGGLVNYDPEGEEAPTRLLLNGGVGVRYYAWRNIALRGELKDFVFVEAERGDYTKEPQTFACPTGLCILPGPPDAETVHNIGFFAGLTFNF